MNAEERGLLLKDRTETLIGLFYEVYNGLGPGFLESVYTNALQVCLRRAGIRAEAEKPLQVWFQGQLVGEFRADLVVDDSVIIEVKAARRLDPAHEAQLLNYLRATDIEVGLLFNFGPKAEFKRLVFSSSHKKSASIRVHPRQQEVSK